MAEASREYKIILIGDPNVGKTCYFLRVRDGNFIETDELRTTILSGVEFFQYTMKIDGYNVTVRLPNIYFISPLTQFYLHEGPVA